MFSNEYIRLKGQGDTKDCDIKPREEFDAFPEGSYIVLNYARMIENGKTHSVLQPGQRVEFGATAKPDDGLSDLSKSEIKQILRDKGISFGSRMSREELMELVR